GRVQSIEQHLGLEETRALLREVSQHTRASVEEVLLSALALACWDCFGSPGLAIELEGHGRQALFADVDLSRTVGWFTSTFSLQYSGQQQLAESMQQLAEAYVVRLQQLIAQAPQADHCLYIPEDFPLLQLSQEGLDRLLAQVADSAPRLAENRRPRLEDLYPLTGMQAGLLFHSQASLESGLYTEQ